MEPIISPWLIYLIGLVDGLKGGLGILGALILFGGIIGFLVWGISETPSDEDIKRGAKWCSKIIIPFALVLFGLSLFIPSSKVIIAMATASIATPDNINSAVQSGKNFKDEIKKDLIDMINAVSAK